MISLFWKLRNANLTASIYIPMVVDCDEQTIHASSGWSNFGLVNEKRNA